LLARQNVAVNVVTLSVTADRCGTFKGPQTRPRRDRNEEGNAGTRDRRSPAPPRNRR
jgi:hypothetical protein